MALEFDFLILRAAAREMVMLSNFSDPPTPPGLTLPVRSARPPRQDEPNPIVFCVRHAGGTCLKIRFATDRKEMN